MIAGEGFSFHTQEVVSGHQAARSTDCWHNGSVFKAACLCEICWISQVEWKIPYGTQICNFTQNCVSCKYLLVDQISSKRFVMELRTLIFLGYFQIKREIFVCYPYNAPPLDMHAFPLKTHLLIWAGTLLKQNANKVLESSGRPQDSTVKGMNCHPKPLMNKVSLLKIKENSVTE